MDKTEVLDKIIKVVNTMPFHYSMIKLPSSEARSIERILDEYTQRVSREDIKSFLEFTCDLNAETLAHVLYNFDKYFDEWIKNQQQ